MSALEEVRELAGAVARRRALTLWDVEMAGAPGRAVVRVYVDARPPAQIDLDTVAEVSEEISRGLDLRDPIAGRYTLEVSSPGLERNLRSAEHFARSVGARVILKTKKPLEETGSHRLDGVITGAGGDYVEVEGSSGALRVPLTEIKSARTVFEWQERSSQPGRK
ncbi:MAG: ribosome maturation factor RimP [Actinomycetota bacterium]